MQRTKSRIELLRLIYFGMILVIVFAGLVYLPRLAVPIIISYVLNLVFSPLIPVFKKFGIPRSASTWIIFAIILFFSIYPFVKVVPMITKETENFHYYIPKVERYIQTEYLNIQSLIENKVGYKIDSSYAKDGLSYAKDFTASFLLNLPKSLASIIEWVFVVPLFVFFMLKDGEKLKQALLKITPNNVFERFYFLSHKFNKKLGDYIFAKFIEAFLVGIIITVGLLLLDVRFALLFGLIAALTNVIPYLGPILGTLPAIIFGLAEYGFGATFGAISILYLIANAVDIGIVFPILVSKIVDLHPIIVVISVILGSQVFGIIGMVISIPLAAALKLIMSEIYSEIFLSRGN